MPLGPADYRVQEHWNAPIEKLQKSVQGRHKFYLSRTLANIAAGISGNRLPMHTADSMKNKGYISTRAPSSRTRLAGSLKYSAALLALRAMVAKSRSRHNAIPAPGLATTISRLRK